MTMPEADYRRLLLRALIMTVLCIAAVLVCYFWIDRPVAFFVYRHHINTIQVFRWLTYPPPEVQNWSALVLTILMVRRAWGPFLRWQKVLLVACLSLIVADDFRISIGDVCGRYWPETWTHDNPSLIGTGTYGFHPFQRGDDIGSFPSGHAARIFGFATASPIPMFRMILSRRGKAMTLSTPSSFLSSGTICRSYCSFSRGTAVATSSPSYV